MTVLITLTTAGSDSGPLFDLYSNSTGSWVKFEDNVSKSALLAGYTSNLVPDGTTSVRVQSDGVCVNHIDITVITSTTTTTSTTTSGPIAQTMILFGTDSSNEACANLIAGPGFHSQTTRYSANVYMNPGDVLYNGPGLTNPAIFPIPVYYAYYPNGQVFTPAWVLVNTEGVVTDAGYCS